MSHLSTRENRRSIMESREDDEVVPSDLEDAETRELQRQETDPPVRHLRIDWPSSTIKGRFAIGPSVPDMQPPLYDMPSSQDVELNSSSAVFLSKTSPINVVVQVLHGQGSQTPHSAPDTTGMNPVQVLQTMQRQAVYVYGKSSHNSVCLHIPQYVGRKPLHVRASSSSGHVTVVLPHSFNGLLRWNTEVGIVGFSPLVTARTQRLDSEPTKKRGTSKVVVDPDLPGWMTAQGRRGDVCEISTHSGRLYVCFSGENPSLAAKNCIIC
ncbi:hypothetical protein MEQU1_003666 [Malassezia equina]|uniref:DUF7330 domain-containing protein n=1 Tax=Malassezia equina TaxID=1381935 RepID=A0AAF0EHS8_9BASI|nr:hypothetical protein MEQU1_003666 [Malassezia equina]